MRESNQIEIDKAVTDTRAASIRKDVRLACPKCWSAEHLRVAAICNCEIDQRGRAWPAGTFDGSYDNDSTCACDCGWVGDIGEAEDAFSECCSVCAAEPGHLRRNATDDGRECTQCWGSDV